MGPLNKQNSGLLTRRAFIGTAVFSFAIPVQARVTRLAAIDWAMMETAIAIGVMPNAACELIRYRLDAIEPSIPNHVVDLGLRGSPNLELLELVEPEIILSSPFYSSIRHRLSSIAEVFELAFYVAGESPWEKALNALNALGQRVGMASAAASAQTNIQKEIQSLADDLISFRERPTYVVQIGDARHFRAFGYDSMFGSVLSELNLENAWTRRSAFSFAAPVPIEKLAEEIDARIIVISGVPLIAQQGLEQSVLWNQLEAVAQNRVYVLDNINPFGGVLAGLRFARLLKNALLEIGS